MKKYYISFFILIFVFLISCISMSPKIQRINYLNNLSTKPVFTGKVISNHVHESSGLARSFLNPNHFLTHNDSFNTAHLFTLSFIPESTCNCDEFSLADLYDEKKIKVEGAFNFDWEDLADDRNGMIYIADSGNNWKLRHFIKVYKVDETQNYKLLERYFFKFPSGKTYGKKGVPVYDIEASYFWDNNLYFITKERNNSAILFQASLDKSRSNLNYIKTIESNWRVTGVDISDNGAIIAVLTCTSVFLYRAENGIPEGKPYALMPIDLGQAEAICFMKDEGRVLVTSEKGLFGVYDVKDFYSFEARLED